MELSDWTKGPPPMIGWWNASKERDPSARRWWDGERFSAPVYVGDPDEHAAIALSTPAEDQDGIEWRGCILASLTVAEMLCISDALSARDSAPVGPSVMSEKLIGDAMTTVRGLELLVRIKARLAGVDEELVWAQDAAR